MSEFPVHVGPLFDPDTTVGRDLAAVAWDSTPLGAAQTWTASLRNIVRLQLGSRFSMWMAWGPQLTFLCNDAYRTSTLGTKYPWALGRPSAEVWSEIWPDIGPRIDSVMSTGIATWDESLLLFLERSGYVEETYHTFSYSPIADDSDLIAGMLCVVSEETARVIGGRRMAGVRDLGTALAAASTQAEVCAAAGRQLALLDRDVPFALGYLFDPSRNVAELAFSAGTDSAQAVGPPILELDDPAAVWPAHLLSGAQPQIVEGLAERFDSVPTGGWEEPALGALLVPLLGSGEAEPLGFLVAGLNRYRPLDAEYQGFLEIVAGQIAAAVLRGRVLEAERQRAEDLAALDRAKTTFFTNVSHELRTPLTLLLGPAADALTDQDHPLPVPQRDRVEVISRNGDRLLNLVNTLLDFSRLEAGETPAQLEPVDLGTYTAELAAMFDSAVRRAGLDYQVDCPPLAEPVYVDREMWAKIVLNLISNALKATFDGSISVSLRSHPGSVTLAVRDTGVGIPQAEQRRLFERFHRVVGATLRSHEGSGIGLALVAELAALHSGTVGVDSEPGIGSTFRVEIPTGTGHLSAAALEAAGATRAAQEAATIGAGFLAEADRWLAATGVEVEDVAADGRPRVLVVDDNADMRDYIASLLSSDYAVQVAVDGVDGLDRARESPPDLVLSDVMMPRLDGFGLLARLRADPTTMHVPVVMLSARAGDEATVEGLEAGADDYLVKPFSARELLARVRANLELDRVRRMAEEMSRSRALLDQAEELAQVGSWELDLADGSIRASTEYYRLLGISAQELAEHGSPFARPAVHPEDLPALEQGLRQLMSGGHPLDLEFRTADGERAMRVLGTVHKDAAGGLGHLRGSLMDVTEQKAAQRAVAAALASREAAAREHAIADELQRSMLPAVTVHSPSLDTAAYYASGVTGTQAGGDWYDLIDLPNNRVALVIGDVMGRGVRAAAIMGQLRAAIGGYARLDLEPAKLLGLLDQTVMEMSEPAIVTCVYAVHDPAAQTLTYVNAGHMPPLLSLPGGPAERLTQGDPPLGTGYYRGHAATVDFPPGARLILYTDGLVEHRGSDIDIGIEALRKVLESGHTPVEALPGRIVDSLLPGGEPDDDVAILAAVVREATSPALRMPLGPTGASAAAARRAVTDWLQERGLDGELPASASLVVSELVTNALRHGRAPIQLHVRLDREGLVVEVSDGAHGRPVARDLDPASVDGRGLHLIDALSSSRGTRPTGAGKAVWCVLPLD